ncbi:S-layer homology domain-containing protein [Paenibacillus sp. YAF4_2]|uniref:S-layer homology domain-containing protein n=1 Tax=Paenibacillus sp. YAF4_2 TaxID=3233085 RepID=UPI003F97B95D
MRKTSNSLSTQNSQQPKVFRGGEKKVMKKSLVSLALAGSMLSALAVPAFAATPSDVVGKPVQTAVEELTALGIINGYADGTFKPDNTITRAELAKVVIVATGNQSAANLMANTAPSFKDVKKGAWYTGYINAAAAKGFIQGYNGNFRPNDTIKFEEVTAILVRALGYKDKYLSGSWPYNVLLQGDEVGLFDGVEMANGTNATRGVVAELTENSLGANLVQYNADGDLSNVKVKDAEQLLINKLGTSTSEILDVTAVTDGKISFVSGDAAVADNFFITGGKKLTDLIGHSVTVLKNKDGKVLAVTDNQASTKIVSTTLKGDQLLNDGTLTTKASTTDYKVADKALLFVNTDPTDFDTKTYTDGTDVQLLLNAAGDVQAILVTKWIPDAQISDIVAYTNYSVINSSGGSFKVDATTSVTLDGKAATLADLKADDIIDVIKNKAGLATKVVATRSVVTGKVEATGKVGTDFTVKVGGKTYVAAFDTVTKLSLDSEYTLYLNKDSKAIAYKAATAAAATDYYVVYTVATKGAPILIDNQLSTDDYYKIVYYSLKDSAKKVAYTKETAVVGALTDNSIAQLTFKDGYVTEVKNPKQLADVKLAKVDSISGTRITLKDNADATTTYVLDGNTVYLKVTDKDADSTVATLAASDVKVGDYVTVSNEGATAKFVVVTTQGSVAELPQVQGLFVNQSSVNSASGTAYYVTLNVNNEEKTFEVQAPIAAVNKYDVVTLVDKDSKNAYYETTGVSVANHKTLIANAPTVDASAKTITLAGVGGTTYVVTENTKFYNINADDTGLAVGYFNDVRVAADTVSGNYGTGKGQYQLVIVDGKDTYGNNFKEAGVVVVVYHN